MRTPEAINYEKITQELKIFQNRINLDPIAFNLIHDESAKSKLADWNTRFVCFSLFSVTYYALLINQFQLVYSNCCQSELCAHFDYRIELRCSEFPRFYFLDKSDLIRTLSYVRDCRKYLGTVRACFPSVRDLVWSVPNQDEFGGAGYHQYQQPSGGVNEHDVALNTTTAQLNFDMNASSLQATCLLGYNRLDAPVRFIAPVRSYSLQSVAEWFDHLLKAIKSSMSKHAHIYVRQLNSYGGRSMNQETCTICLR